MTQVGAKKRGANQTSCDAQHGEKKKKLLLTAAAVVHCTVFLPARAICEENMFFGRDYFAYEIRFVQSGMEGCFLNYLFTFNRAQFAQSMPTERC